MPPTITGDYHSELLNTMRDLARGSKWWSAPINLGGAPGPSGGAGIPVGGIYGQLIQTKVAYDSSEAAYSGIMTNIPSGTLVDNLAHIRSRLGTLEIASGVVIVNGSYWEPLAAPDVTSNYNDEFVTSPIGIQWTEFDPTNNLIVVVEDWGLQLTPDPNSHNILGVYQIFEDSPDDWTFWTKVDLLSLQAGGYKAGIVLLSGVINETSPMYWFGVATFGAGINAQFEKWIDYTTFDSSFLNETLGGPSTPHAWLRVRTYNGSGVRVDISQDGIGWWERYDHPGLDFGNIGAVGFITSSDQIEDATSVFPFFRSCPGNNRITVTKGNRVGYILD